MNSRFKFRAWDKRTKRIVIVNEIYDPDGNDDKYHITGKSDYCRKENEVILMQSTGLRDKNGKLIFEGDILKQTRYYSDRLCDFVVQVVWRQAGFSAIAIYEPAPMSPYSLFFSGKNEDSIEWEIIGNIYENPELLQDSGMDSISDTDMN